MIMKLPKALQRLFARKSSPAAPAGGDMAGSSLAPKMLEMLARTQEVELSCDEVFALLDEFAERAARGEDMARLMPLVQQHLELCGDCQEEYQALLNVLNSKTR